MEHGLQVSQESRCVTWVGHPAGLGRREEGEEVMPVWVYVLIGAMAAAIVLILFLVT